ncbi:MAG: CPBP family intramembrane glutamic endopeptidase [Chloroflexota bacterium]
MNDYLEVARTGKNNWWRYLLSLPGILGAWLIVGSIPVFVLAVYVMTDDDPATRFIETGFTGIPVLLDFTVTMSTFFPFIIATLLAVRFLHARSLRTLVTGWERIRWGRIFEGGLVWFGLAAVIAVIEARLHPGRYVLTFQPFTLAMYTLVALILIPIQTSTEELFFRGYLLQWMGLILKNKWALALINGVLFFLPHAINPEMSSSSNAILMGLGYFAFGFFAALITIEDNGMELALGMHASNNLFASIFANYNVSALHSPALFTVQELDAGYGLASTVLAMVVFHLVFFDWKTLRHAEREDHGENL